LVLNIERFKNGDYTSVTKFSITKKRAASFKNPKIQNMEMNSVMDFQYEYSLIFEGNPISEKMWKYKKPSAFRKKHTLKFRGR